MADGRETADAVRPTALLAGLIGVLALMNEITWIGRSSLALPIILLGAAVVLLAIGQMRHG